jgi:hypothetical protein
MGGGLMNAEFDFVKEIPTKQIPKIGRVYFCLEYFVDLNDNDMVEHAKDSLFEDIHSLVKYQEVYECIGVQESPEHNYDDIADFLKESIDDE